MKKLVILVSFLIVILLAFYLFINLDKSDSNLNTKNLSLEQNKSVMENYTSIILDNKSISNNTLVTPNNSKLENNASYYNISNMTKVDYPKKILIDIQENKITFSLDNYNADFWKRGLISWEIARLNEENGQWEPEIPIFPGDMCNPCSNFSCNESCGSAGFGPPKCLLANQDETFEWDRFIVGYENKQCGEYQRSCTKLVFAESGKFKVRFWYMANCSESQSFSTKNAIAIEKEFTLINTKACYPLFNTTSSPDYGGISAGEYYASECTNKTIESECEFIDIFNASGNYFGASDGIFDCEWR